MNKPKIVTLCGSSKFVDIMAVIAWWIERDEGKIVHTLHLLPGWYSADLPADHLAEQEGVADQLDALHLAKIDLSDEVFIVNWEGYIGDSTTNELTHAIDQGKTIRWLVEPEEGLNRVGSVDVAMYDRVYARIKAAKDRR